MISLQRNLERRRAMSKRKKRKKIEEKIKRGLYGKRLSLPANKRHKSKKDYKRKNKVRIHELEKET
jgi:hypothetical protein